MTKTQNRPICVRRNQHMFVANVRNFRDEIVVYKRKYHVSICMKNDEFVLAALAGIPVVIYEVLSFETAMAEYQAKGVMITGMYPVYFHRGRTPSKKLRLNNRWRTELPLEVVKGDGSILDHYNLKVTETVIQPRKKHTNIKIYLGYGAE